MEPAAYRIPHLCSPSNVVYQVLIDYPMDGSRSDINLLWACNPQTQILPTPHKFSDLHLAFLDCTPYLNLQASDLAYMKQN